MNGINYQLLTGNSLKLQADFPAASVQMSVSSPPYYNARDYEEEAEQLGREDTPEDYVANLVAIYRQTHRLLKPDGTLWVNISDTYAGSGGAGNQFNQLEKGLKKYKQSRLPPGLKKKDLIGIPWRFALAMQADGVADLKAMKVLERVMAELTAEYKGQLPDRVQNVLDRLMSEYAEAKGASWWLRQDIIWHKTNGKPEPAKDKCARAHEYIFLFSKSPQYYFDYKSIQVPSKSQNRKPAVFGGKKAINNPIKPSDPRYRNGHEDSGRTFQYGAPLVNLRSVWSSSVSTYRGEHFATYPPQLILPCILAGSRPGDTVIDPFSGTATTGQVALERECNYIGIDLSEKYTQFGHERLAEVSRRLAVKNYASQLELFN